MKSGGTFCPFAAGYCFSSKEALRESFDLPAIIGDFPIKFLDSFTALVGVLSPVAPLAGYCFFVEYELCFFENDFRSDAVT